MKSNFNRFSPIWVKWVLVISTLYWLWKGLVIGVGTVEILLFSVWFVLCFISAGSRKLIIGFAPLFVYMFLYNSLKILHIYNPFTIHNEALYNLELRYFGVNLNGARVTLCEYFNEHLHPILDFISGASYITWVPFPVLFGIFLFIKKRNKLLFDFWLAFLVVNLIGIFIYIVLPAAPPWYYLNYGVDIIPGLGGQPAGLARFDDIIGTDLYKNMYSEGSNTYGALPSMHAAFPIVLSFYGFKYGNKILLGIFLISMVCIWFGAIYTNHHYLIDILMGMTCAIIGIFLAERIVNGNFAANWYQKTISYLVKTP